MVFLFHNLKNLCHRDCIREFEDWTTDCDPLLSRDLGSFSWLLMQASITPLGEESMSFTFSTSKHLNSTSTSLQEDDGV